MCRKLVSLFLVVSFLFQQTGLSYALSGVDMSGYLSGLSGAVTQDKFRPLHMRYFSYDAQNNDFNLLLDKGDEKELKDKELKDKTAKLLEYFKIGLSLPNDKFWVNLRPDAQDEIIDPDLEKTDIGKVLLEADLQLKKDTAGATSPQTAEGKQYWDKLYKKAGELFGTENVTIPTVTRPWIVPGEVIINTSTNAAYIYKASLKVMLEEDYLSRGGFEPAPTSAFSDPRLKELNQYSTQLIRELIIPQLTKEINTAKRYSALRQVFYSLVLAKWFKKSFAGKTGEYSSLIDTNNLTGLISQESWSKLSYFNEYKKSFQDGEYNLKEPVYSTAGQALRSYVSGGTLPMSGEQLEIPVKNMEILRHPDMINMPASANTPLTTNTGINQAKGELEGSFREANYYPRQVVVSSAVINKSDSELKSLIQENQSKIRAAIMDLKVKNIISVEDEDLKEYRIVDGIPLNITLSDGEKIAIDNHKLNIIKEKILPAVLKEYDLRGPDYSLLEELAKEDSGFSRDLARFLDEERKKDLKKYDGNKAKSWNKEALVLLGIALAQTGFESHHGLERLNPGNVFIMAGDNGPSTPVIRHYLAEGLRLAGIMVIDLGLCSSGELYTSIERFGVQGGLYVTRSHVELGTNGFKPKIGKTTLFAEMITRLGETIKANKFNLLAKGVIADQAKVDAIKMSSRKLYLAHIALEFGLRLKELLRKFPDSKFAFDCGNGSSTEYVDFLKEMLGDNLVKVFRDKPDPFCKSGLADASRSDEVALGHPKSAGDKSIVRWSKDNPDVLIFNFDLDMDRCSIMKNGILYKGEKVFYPLVEYGLAVESNEIKQNEYLSDLRMSPAFGEMVRHFGGKVVSYPKGHSKIKADVEKTLSVLAKENHTASIKEFINKSGYRNRQAEFSLHMFYVNEEGACVDDALHFMFEWLTAFGAVIGRKKSDFDYSGYIASLEKEGVISKWYTIEEQRTPMQDEHKKKFMNDLRDYIRDRFQGRADFEYLSYNALRRLGGVMEKKFTLVDVDGVYGFFTPLGIFYWGWSNTSEKIAFGAHSRDKADIKKLVEIMMACFYELRDKLPNLRDDSKEIADGETRDYLNIMEAKTNPEAQKLVLEKYSSAEKAIAGLATASSAAAEQANDFKGGGIDIKGDSWIQVSGINNIREFSDILPGNINRELDIDRELKDIRDMIQGGSIPSPQRLGEDIAYCLYQDRFGAHKDDIELSLMGVGRLKEDYGLDMGREYLRILSLVQGISNPFESENYVSED